MSVLEYLLMTLIIAVAFVTYRAKERYFLTHLGSYNKLMAGMMAFLAVFLVKAIGATGAFAAIAGGDGPILQSILQALGMVAGGLFAGVGLVEWLPKLAAAQVQAHRAHDRLQLLEAAAFARRESRDPRSYTADLAALLTMTFHDAAIESYRFDRDTRTLAALNRPRTEIGRDTCLSRLCVEAIEKNTCTFASSGIEGDHRPLVALPVSADIETVYLLCIVWPLETQVDNGVEQLLNSLANQSVVASQGERNVDLTGTFAGLRRKLAGAERLADQMVEIDSALQGLVSYDVLRIAVFDERGLNVTQYALGQGKNLLTERDKLTSTRSTRLAEMFVDGDLCSCDNLEASEYADDRWLANCGAHRAVSIPLSTQERTLAVLTLAAEDSDPGICTSDAFVRELNDSLMPLIQTDLLTQQTIAFNRRVLDLTSTLKQVVETGICRDSLAAIAETVAKQFPATYARVWTYEPTTDTFYLAASADAPSSNAQTLQGSTVPAGHVPRHRQAILSRKLTIISQGNVESEMGVEEQELTLMPDVKSALLVPLTSEDTALGILAIGEVRNPQRRQFSLSETLFARGMASIATLSLLSSERSEQFQTRLRSRNRLTEIEPELDHVFRLPQRLATPLTSILARSQQLLGTELGKEELPRRNLQIIKEQTERIIREIRTVQEARQEQITEIAPSGTLS